MGAYKRIKTNMFEIKFDVIYLILSIFVVFFALASVSLANDNRELLKQVDEAMGENNELKFSNEKLNKENEELKKEYERLVDVIRTSDRYQMSEGMEE